MKNYLCQILFTVIASKDCKKKLQPLLLSYFCHKFCYNIIKTKEKAGERDV